MIMNVRRKLKNTTRLIEVPASGFLPRASTLLPDILPNETKPMTKLAPVTSVARMYRSVITGVKNGDSRPDFNAESIFVVPLKEMNCDLTLRKTDIFPTSSLLVA